MGLPAKPELASAPLSETLAALTVKPETGLTHEEAAARLRSLIGASSPAAALSFKPFDPKTRRTEAVVERDGERLRVMKGAVRSLAEACGLTVPELEALEARAQEAGCAGSRVLAVAQGPEGGAAAVIGLVTLADPPRPEAAQLIVTLRELGVAVKMLTGDALSVASEVARTVGLTGIRPEIVPRHQLDPKIVLFLAELTQSVSA